MFPSRNDPDTVSLMNALCNNSFVSCVCVCVFVYVRVSQKSNSRHWSVRLVRCSGCSNQFHSNSIVLWISKYQLLPLSKESLPGLVSLQLAFNEAKYDDGKHRIENAVAIYSQCMEIGFAKRFFFISSKFVHKLFCSLCVFFSRVSIGGRW